MTKKATVLERARRAAKLHKAKLARMAGMSRSHYGRVEAGESRVSYLAAKRISVALEKAVTPLQIMDLCQDPPTRKTRAKSKEAA